jgi:4-diphosphocytidyl-2C-methyl-D-erythritol kinase
LVALGAYGAMMSGSGTAVFGVFDSYEAASYAAKDIEGAIVCKSAPAYKLH